MSRLVDALRCFLISPELLLLLGAIAIAEAAPSIAGFFEAQVASNIVIGSAIAAAPLAALAWGWSQVWDMLKPSGVGAALAEWPHYYMLKARALASLIWCVVGSGLGFISIPMISLKWHPSIAVGLLLGGVLAAASAIFSLALARIKLRELLSR